MVDGLEEEVTRLREYIARLKSVPPSDRNDPSLCPASAEATGHELQSQNQITGSATDVDPVDVVTASRQLHVAVDGFSAFHGHTSIFDHPGGDTASQPSGLNTRPAYAFGDDAKEAEYALTDAAARGRTQEILDLAAGRLDFDDLPAETAMELLDIHWHRQHHALLLTYRPAFMRDMAVPGGGRYFSKLLLNVIYFGAAKFSRRLELRSDPEDPRTAGHQFLKRINELIGVSISRSSIPSVQALLLLASSLFALGQHQSSWLYSGLAFRMLVDLGLHIDNTAFDKTLSAEDVEIRRRLVYGSFCFDKIHSLYQGRPPTLQEADIQVPLIFNDLYEEDELWRPSPASADGRRITKSIQPSPYYSVTTFTATVKLCLILGRALHLLYSFASFKASTEQHLASLRSLTHDFERFVASLPPHLADKTDVCAANVLALR